MRLADYHDATYPICLKTGLMQQFLFVRVAGWVCIQGSTVVCVSLMTTRVLLLPLIGDEKHCDGLSETHHKFAHSHEQYDFRESHKLVFVF